MRYDYVEAGEVMDFDGYYRAVERVLDDVGQDGVDAVVSSDIGAAFCIREASRRGISVPRDLQIIGYDGTYLTDVAGMKMTAATQDFSAIAEAVVGRITQAIDDEDAAAARAPLTGDGKPFEPNVLIPVSITMGDTTRAVPPAGDRS